MITEWNELLSVEEDVYVICYKEKNNVISYYTNDKGNRLFFQSWASAENRLNYIKTLRTYSGLFDWEGEVAYPEARVLKVTFTNFAEV